MVGKARGASVVMLSPHNSGLLGEGRQPLERDSVAANTLQTTVSTTLQAMVNVGKSRKHSESQTPVFTPQSSEREKPAGSGHAPEPSLQVTRGVGVSLPAQSQDRG